MDRQQLGESFRDGFLTQSDMQRIHQQALLVLENTGIVIGHSQCLHTLAAAGAQVDFETEVVRFPPSIVEACLTQVPRKIVLAGRIADNDLILQPGGEMVTRNTGGMVYVRDVQQGEVKAADLDDVADYTKMVDALPNIDFLAPLYAKNLIPPSQELETLKTILNHTGKHINMRAMDIRTLPYLAALGEVVAGSREQLKARPVISFLESPISPLKFPDIFIETILVSGDYGIPVEVASSPIFGATGPITIASAILLTVVEHLAAFVVGQVAHPGMPMIWAPRYIAMDMASGYTGVTMPSLLASAAAGQLIGEFYGMLGDLYGPISNAIVPGQQAVIEDTLIGLATVLHQRPSILCGSGAVEFGTVASLEELVVSDRFFGMVRQITAQQEITDLSISAAGQQIQDLVEGAAGLSKHPQNKPSSPPALVDEVKTILANHKPQPLAEDLNREIDTIIASAEAAFSD